MIRQYNATRCRGGDNPLRVGTIAVGSIFYIQDEGFFRDRYSPRAVCRNPWIVEAFLNGTMGAARRNRVTGLWESAFISGRSDTAVVRSLRDGRRRTIAVRSLVIHDDLFLTKEPTRYPDLPNLALYRGRHRRSAAATGDSPIITARIVRLTASLRRMSAVEADRALCQMTTDDLLAIGADLGLRLPRPGGDKPAAIVAALGKRAGNCAGEVFSRLSPPLARAGRRLQ
jgi:hypothetical protein